MSIVFHNGFTEVMRLDSSGNLGIGSKYPIWIPIDVNQKYDTRFKDVPTEVLRNLWVVRFNGRAAPLEELGDVSMSDDIIEIGKELAHRGLMTFDTLHRPDRMETEHYYILERSNADN